MKYEICSSPTFERNLKRLCKRYASIPDDYEALLRLLEEKPSSGVLVYKNVRKLRMAIRSKGNGRSGGARVLTLDVLVSEEEHELTLLTVYDKSERSTINDKEIARLVAKTLSGG